MTTSPSGNISDGAIFQNSIYIGISIENILYGVELSLYFKTIYILLTSRRPGASKGSDVLYAVFSSIMVFLVTVWVATQALFGEQMWLLQSGFPGGPGAFWGENISNWYMDWATTSIIVLQLMTDGLMIYRCRIIWDSYRVVVFPIILWLATLALGLLMDVITSTPGGNLFTNASSKIGLAYYTISIFLNTTLTCMICYRMVQHARMIQECLGHEYATLYFTAVTIIVESVLPYTLCGITFLVSLGISSHITVVFGYVNILMMAISPQMLILRMISGRAWDKDTLKRPGSTVMFSPGAATDLQIFESNGAKVQLQTVSGVYLPEEHGNVQTSQMC